MKLFALVFAFSMLGGSPTVSQNIEERTVAFGCDDLVVVGSVKNGDWHRLDDPDDFIGHGWVDARLSIRRVVRGSVDGRTVALRYFTHTYMRDDRDFMFVLSRQPDGSFVINIAQLMSAHPKLAGQCG